MTVVVRPASPIRTARDIQEKLRSDPAFRWRHQLPHRRACHARDGVDVDKLKTVVFQSNSQALTALMGGHVEVATLSAASALQAAEQGQVRIVGITAERRGDGALAQVPTFKEQGLDVVFSNTRFLVGPRGMSGAQTAYWDNILARVVQTEEWKQDLLKDQSVPDYAGSRRAGERMAMLHRQLRGVLADAGLAKDDK